ncbi:hypothetical protein [Methanomethylovorans sp.]|uniref:hypothetical protein n=1 Tax=Methanomethylovorans sp. TaxID=2758717 RepID=UPI003D0D14D6
MKKFLPILILAIVAFGFGCTGTQEKTFSGDGITFTYPESWKNLSVSELESYIPTSEFGSANVITYLGNDTEEFAVVELKASGAGYVRSPSEFIGQIKSSIQDSKIIKTDENMTVAGHKAGMIQYAYGNNYVTIIHIKIDENHGYQVYYWSPKTEQTTLNKILKSFKIS